MCKINRSALFFMGNFSFFLFFFFFEGARKKCCNKVDVISHSYFHCFFTFSLRVALIALRSLPPPPFVSLSIFLCSALSLFVFVVTLACHFFHTLVLLPTVARCLLVLV